MHLFVLQLCSYVIAFCLFLYRFHPTAEKNYLRKEFIYLYREYDTQKKLYNKQKNMEIGGNRRKKELCLNNIIFGRVIIFFVGV